MYILFGFKTHLYVTINRQTKNRDCPPNLKGLEPDYSSLIGRTETEIKSLVSKIRDIQKKRKNLEQKRSFVSHLDMYNV